MVEQVCIPHNPILLPISMFDLDRVATFLELLPAIR